MTEPTPDPEVEAELVATVKEGLSALPAEDVLAQPLAVPAGSPPLWVVYSAGLLDFAGEVEFPSHFVAVYGREAGQWRQVAYLDLDKDGMGPTFLGDGGVSQVQLDPTAVFIQVEGGVGAHGGVYQLLKLEGSELKTEVAASAASPGFSRTMDLNDDGTPEIVLDVSDAYVFCYACGVRKTDYQVLWYDPASGHLREATPRRLPGGDAAGPAAEAIQRAVSLAAAGLWKDAAAEAARADEMATGLSPDDLEALRWNRALIDLYAETMAQRVASSPYPLLSNVFYGDYAAAVDLMRAYAPEQVFSAESPLIAGTVAEGYEESLIYHLRQSTALALDHDDRLAPAYFLRGWSQFLAEPGSPAVQADVAKAAELAPDDELFKASLHYLTLSSRQN